MRDRDRLEVWTDALVRALVDSRNPVLARAALSVLEEEIQELEESQHGAGEEPVK